MRRDRRIDMKLIFAFRNFVEAPNNKLEKQHPRPFLNIGILFYDVLLKTLFQSA
jgi:hypothetical protein